MAIKSKLNSQTFQACADKAPSCSHPQHFTHHQMYAPTAAHAPPVAQDAPHYLLVCPSSRHLSTALILRQPLGNWHLRQAIHL